MPRELQDLRRKKAAKGGEEREKEERTVGSSLCSVSYSIYSLSSFVTRRWRGKQGGSSREKPDISRDILLSRQTRYPEMSSVRSPSSENASKISRMFRVYVLSSCMHRRPTNHGKCTRWIRHVCISTSCSLEREMKYSCCTFCYIRRYFIHR